MEDLVSTDFYSKESLNRPNAKTKRTLKSSVLKDASHNGSILMKLKIAAAREPGRAILIGIRCGMQILPILRMRKTQI